MNLFVSTDSSLIVAFRFVFKTLGFLYSFITLTPSISLDLL